jgi:prepilin-type N-terminal cleavage/methylation domain-containing protein
MNKIQKKIARGFTLIEILIVIGIIAILAAIVLVAVNPAKNFREAANTQRSANVNAIINAVGQYIVDNKGNMPSGLDGSDFSDDVLGGSNITGSMSNFDALCNDLVPEYIGALPVDPNEDEYQMISESSCSDDDISTQYEISLDEGRITVTAPNTVNVETGNEETDPDKIISVTR